jgi:hypothetical protein
LPLVRLGTRQLRSKALAFLLKKNYHHKNIYTFEQLCDSWNEASDRITLHEVTDEFFKYYYDFENMFYDTITSGCCEPDHVYTFDLSKPMVLTIKFNLLNTYVIRVQDMKKDGTISDADHVHQLRLWILLETIPFPSIPEVVGSGWICKRCFQFITVAHRPWKII